MAHMLVGGSGMAGFSERLIDLLWLEVTVATVTQDGHFWELILYNISCESMHLSTGRKSTPLVLDRRIRAIGRAIGCGGATLDCSIRVATSAHRAVWISHYAVHTHAHNLAMTMSTSEQD